MIEKEIEWIVAQQFLVALSRSDLRFAFTLQKFSRLV
jgi:hypothetical protein